jgi:Protein of unknown function (DUF2934)
VFKRLFAALRTTLTGRYGTPLTPATSPAEPRRGEPRRVEESVVPKYSSPRGTDRSPSSERIAFHAYHRWLSRGKPIGTDWEDWFDAERDLQATA